MIDGLKNVVYRLYFQYLAWRNDVPYTFHRLWVTGKLYMADEDELFRDRYELHNFSGRGSPGEVFGLLGEDDKRHLYEITGRHHPGGSDHFIDPWEYSFRYVGTMGESEYQEHQDRIRQQQTGPNLLPIW